MVEDQDKLAAEWAAALEQQDASEAGGAKGDQALADAWSAALGEQEKGGSDQALADEWAKALADEEETKIQHEKSRRFLPLRARISSTKI